MVTEIYMPRLGQTMEEGKLIRWLKPIGWQVARGDAIAEIETDKSTFEIEAEGDGVMRAIFVEEDETVSVGTTLGYIAEPDETVPDGPKIPRDAQPIPMPGSTIVKADAVPQTVAPVKASPAAKKLARDNAVDLSMVTPSGADGVVSVADVERYLERAASADTGGIYETESRAPMSSLRKRIANRLRTSLDSALHVSSTVEVDAVAIRKHADKISAESGSKISITDVLVSLVAQTLRDVPQLNSVCDGEFISRIRNVNIGVAVAVPDGLLVPVVRNADQMEVPEIASKLRELIDKARGGELSPDEYSYGTFTISNLGMLGVESFTSIINPPEAAILGIGAVMDRVRVVGGQAAIRPVFKVTLNIDHRVADGVIAAEFLGKLKARCEGLG